VLGASATELLHPSCGVGQVSTNGDAPRHPHFGRSFVCRTVRSSSERCSNSPVAGGLLANLWAR